MRMYAVVRTPAGEYFDTEDFAEFDIAPEEVAVRVIGACEYTGSDPSSKGFYYNYRGEEGSGCTVVVEYDGGN